VTVGIESKRSALHSPVALQLCSKRLTVVVGADLERLVAPHDETDLLGLLVLQETNITGTTLLPLGRLGDEAEQLGAPVVSEGEQRKERISECSMKSSGWASLESKRGGERCAT
jgi:hypothetical protein